MTHPHATTPSHVAHGASYRAMRLTVRRYLLMPIGALIALVWANTAPESYFQFSHGLSFFVNETAMGFVFALLAQEVFEATMPGGALHSWRKWTLPLVAAAGAVAVSAATYLVYIQSQYEPGLASGWPVATAVDVVLTFYLLR